MFKKDDLDNIVSGSPEEKVQKTKDFIFRSGEIDINRLAAILSLILDSEKSKLRNWLDLQEKA